MDAQQGGEDFPESGFELKGDVEAEGGRDLAGVNAIEGNEVNAAVIEAEPASAKGAEVAVALASVGPRATVFEKDAVV